MKKAMMWMKGRILGSSMAMMIALATMLAGCGSEQPAENRPAARPTVDPGAEEMNIQGTPSGNQPEPGGAAETPATTATNPPAATGGGPVGEPAVTMEAASQLYAGICQMCHGPKGEGETGLGSSLVDGVWVHAQTDAEIAKVIKEGLMDKGLMMQGYGSFMNDEEVTALIGFLRKLEQDAGASAQ